MATLDIILRAHDQASAAMNRFGRSLTAIGRQADMLGNTMMLASAAIAMPLVGLGVAATKMAMDVEESENLFNVSMGNMADDARQWSQTLRDQLGLNATELRRSVGLFNSMFTSMDLPTEASYDMAKGLVTLSKDLASFYNLAEDDSLQKLRAGIMGETEPLKALGIAITETRVQAWAMEKGFAKAGQELNEQQKIVARYGLILESTANAQGDLARTMDSPANQLRMFQNRLREAGEEAGKTFLPMISGALLWINNKGMPAVRDAIKRMQDAWSEMSDHAKVKMVVVAGLFLAGGPLLKAMAVAIRAVGLFASAFALLPSVAKAAIGITVAGLLVFHEQIANIAEGLAGMFESLAKGLEYMQGFGYKATGLRDAAAGIRGFANALRDPGAAFKDLATIAIDTVMPAFDRLVDGLATGAETIVGDFFTIGDAVKQQGDAIDTLPPKIDMTADEFAKLGKSAGDSGQAAKKVAEAATEVSEASQTLGVSISDITNALIEQHPAMIRTTANTRYWQMQIGLVNMALQANQDQMRAAQADLSNMSARLSELNNQLSDARSRLSDLANARLPGQGAMEDQLFVLQQRLKMLQLAAAQGIPIEQVFKQFPFATAAMQAFANILPTDVDAIQKLIDQMQLTQSLKFDDQLRQLAKAAQDTPKEIPFAQALKQITDTKQTIADLTGEIRNQEDAIRNQQGLIAGLQEKQEALNRELQEYQKKLGEAESSQKLVNDALQMAFQWLLQNRQKYTELGDEGQRVADVIDEETRNLLMSITKAASGTTSQSALALGDMVKNYQLRTTESLIEIARVETGFKGVSDKIKLNIDDVGALTDALNAIPNIERTVTIYYRNEGAPPPGRAAGGPVSAGRAYTVGELGPELFVPSVSGSIIPNSTRDTATSIDYNRLASALAAQPIVIQIDGEELVVRGYSRARSRGRL